MSFPLGPQDAVYPGLSFPDPIIEGPVRPAGQGCNSCVHQHYCRVFYWYVRYTENNPDNTIGVQCGSWSDLPSDTITTISADDTNYNNYMNDENLLQEPRRGSDEEGESFGGIL